jgi:hypothetical protein
MAKRLSVLEKAIREIDEQIHSLRLAREVLVQQQLRTPAKQPPAPPAPAATNKKND